MPGPNRPRYRSGAKPLDRLFTIAVVLVWAAVGAGGCDTALPARRTPPRRAPDATTSSSSHPHTHPHPHPQRPSPRLVTVTIQLNRLGPRVPHDFLGLSFEASSIPLFARIGTRGDLPRLLRSLGPGLLRFGGVSADTQVAWRDPWTPRPAWASTTLDEQDLLGLRRLARASGWRIVLTIGLAHFDPFAAAREAVAAERTLGRLLAGVELGNEPDAYGRHGLRSQPWTLARYDADIDAYRRAIAKFAPRTVLFGPDLSGSLIFKRWAYGYARSQQPALLTGHHYPLGCRQTPPPSVARLLSVPVRQAEDQSLERFMTVARSASIPFRLDESGSVSCGGTAGISDALAAALWAIDYIDHAMAAGVSGINFEGNIERCSGYTPLCAANARALAQGELIARPEWYALLAARSLLGDEPVRVTPIGTAADVDLLASLGERRALHVLVVDDEASAGRRTLLAIRLPRGYRSAVALSLSAASSTSSVVRLGGRGVARDGFWRAGPAPRLAVSGDRLKLMPRPDSATLLTLR